MSSILRQVPMEITLSTLNIYSEHIYYLPGYEQRSNSYDSTGALGIEKLIQVYTSITPRVVFDGSNTIYYSFNRQEIINSSLKRCIFRACYGTDENPPNGCWGPSYLEFTDIVNTSAACGPGIRVTYSKYRIPLLGFSFCARLGHTHLSFNPCSLGNL